MKLETERLILREFVPDDWERVLEYQSNPLYLRYYEWTASDRTPESVQEFVGWFLDNQKEAPRLKFQMAVTLKSKELLIGNCGVRMDKVDAVEAEIGYELDPEYWNHGYATESARAIVDFGFSRFGVHRIWANCVADNTGSAHVLEKLGMKLEGCLREKEFYKGKWWDTLLYGILVDEWKEHNQSYPMQWKEIKE
ncbi:MAG: GNAT family N-acetyltransferase [Anaerolineales bacterium]|nr:GNAT family N-acetyltransferase [Anaerolineae bacterium]PWB76021.1 MAG: GNAT family N-acetyltransferase [Anaerolineales bacterium]